MSEKNELKLDVRELEHPKPLELAIKALRELNNENYLYMIHRKNPIPLLNMASEQGLVVDFLEDEKKNWHILISKSDKHNISDIMEKNV